MSLLEDERRRQEYPCYHAFGDLCPVKPRRKLWDCQACYELASNPLPPGVESVVDSHYIGAPWRAPLRRALQADGAGL